MDNLLSYLMSHLSPDAAKELEFIWAEAVKVAGPSEEDVFAKERNQRIKAAEEEAAKKALKAKEKAEREEARIRAGQPAPAPGGEEDVFTRERNERLRAIEEEKARRPS